jgi:16S rRNA (cytidine1402-2'-O)-methyltransferase
MPGTLFLVATPIGNLEDITLRALRVLREAGLIAAEDTRRTAQLLTHFGIRTPLLSFHEHSGPSKRELIRSRLAGGVDVALVSDAGTPVLSDPGLELVQACIADGIPVDPVPGASAPLAAAIASGFPLASLTILGFVPSRSKDRKEWLRRIGGVSGTVTFFESPVRIRATLEEAATSLGNRQICVARELSKVHQEFVRGDAKTVLESLGTVKGEFTVVVGPVIGQVTDSGLATDAEVVRAFERHDRSSGMSRRDIVVTVARELGVPPKHVYAAVERAKKVEETAVSSRLMKEPR